MDDVFKNPLRRKILEMLYSKKSATAKEISEELKIGVPAVYYHIEFMKDYVAKSARGEFAATEKGLVLYRETIKEDVISKMHVSRVVPFFAFIQRRSAPKILLPVSMAVGALEFVVCYYENFRPFLFGYSSAISTARTLIMSFAMNVVIIFSIIETASYFLTKRMGGELLLFNGILISRLPLVLILCPYIFGLGGTILSLITLALGPLISIGMLSLFVAVSKGIRYEIAIIMSFAMLYIDIFIYAVR